MTSTPPVPSDLVPPVFVSENAQTVFEKRYLRKGADGKPTEDARGAFWRVAWNVALAEEEFGGDTERVARQFYNLMASFDFLPNSPTFTGAGTPLGQLSACFVLELKDEMGAEKGGIFDTLRTAALIQKTGGGNGFAFSRLRPKGALIKSSMGQASGPVSFMRAYDACFDSVRQGSTRRGANMGVLRSDHPDIEEFIECKSTEGEIANFNISVGIQDALMEAVKNGGNWDLVFDGKVYKTIDARELFRGIIRNAHKNGEPGVIFLDTANRANAVPHLYELEASNPCAEQIMGPDESCTLGSVNLSRFVLQNEKGEYTGIDWDGLREAIRLATRFLDNVVSANKYVPAVPAIKEAALRTRRIGLGVMGFADLLYMLGIRYGSPLAQEVAAQIAEFVRYYAMRESIRLANERGAFPAFKGSIYDTARDENEKWGIEAGIGELFRKHCESKTKLADVGGWRFWNGLQEDQWVQTGRDIQLFGIRNACQTTVAPTGTLSTVSGVEGYGCEPVFALAYTRWLQDGETRVSLQYVSPLFREALERLEPREEERQRIIETVSRTGTCKGTGFEDVFVVASDISTEEHVRMQASFQRFTSNAVSKTINLPNEATEQDVYDAYMLAWELGCKGITVYRAGSREKVVLETKETALTKQPNQSHIEHDKKPRARKLPGFTYKTATPLGEAYITINTNGNNQPFEVFANVGKAGSDTFAISEAFGRLISLILRLPSEMTPTERIKEIIKQLGGIGGGRPMGFGPNRVSSLPDAIAQVLMEYLGQPQQQATPMLAVEAISSPFAGRAELCPSCGFASLVNEEGCKKCYSCNHSEC